MLLAQLFSFGVLTKSLPQWSQLMSARCSVTPLPCLDLSLPLLFPEGSAPHLLILFPCLGKSPLLWSPVSGKCPLLCSPWFVRVRVCTRRFSGTLPLRHVLWQPDGMSDMLLPGVAAKRQCLDTPRFSTLCSARFRRVQLA